MLPQRRLLLVVAAALLVAAPAAILAGLCLGNSCRRSAQVGTRVPFCSLPPDLRSLIEAGFRDGRSPHILAVAGTTPVVSSDMGTRWPSVDDLTGTVPLVFAGTGVAPGIEVPDGARLDAIAPTLAEIIGLQRPHPAVRSGEAIPGLAPGEEPRLVVLVAWKGVSSEQLERQPQTWPVLRGLIEDGAATMEATAGSLPTDPPAILTTIGTGALPSDHGITGSLVRNDQGAVVSPWSEKAPFSVVAALGDDLDELRGQEPRIGLIGTEVSDRGLIGGNWYEFRGNREDDDVVIEPDPEHEPEAAAKLLDSGYGGDGVTDLLAIAAEGPIRRLDDALGRVLAAAKRASGGSFLIAVTSTGDMRAELSEGFPVTELESDVEARIGADVIEAFALGGLFLDQDAMTRSGLSDDRVVAALHGVMTPDGERLLADTFPAIAVTFARYC